MREIELFVVTYRYQKTTIMSDDAFTVRQPICPRVPCGVRRLAQLCRRNAVQERNSQSPDTPRSLPSRPTPVCKAKLSTPKHLDRTHRRIRQRAHQPQQTVSARAHPQPGSQPRPSPPGQRQPERLQHPSQQPSTPSVRAGQTRNLLGERTSGTPGVIAEEPANPQLNHYQPRRYRGVGQPLPIAAVYPDRTVLTPRTHTPLQA